MSDHDHTAPQSPLAPLLRTLEDSSALDPARRLGDRISGTLMADSRVRSLLQGRWLGHALHPLLVQLPLGAWTSASILDAQDLLTPHGNRAATDSAQLLTAVGLLAVPPAALSGWAEYVETGPRERRVAVVHAGTNALGIACQAGSLLARWRGHQRLGAALGLGGSAAIAIAGYLGGHLSVARKVGTRDPLFADGGPVAG